MKSLPSLLRCRLSRKQLVRLLTPAFAFVPALNAADVSKANNADALNLTTSWTSGVLPTSSDVAVFDSTVTSIVPDATNGFSYMQFPAAASWQGVRVVGAVDKLSVDSFGFGLPGLTIGSAGLDFSAATSGNTFEFFGQAITIGAFQTWNVADGATVLFSNGSIARAQGVTLKINLGTTGTGLINPTTTFGAANAVLPYATISGGDFVAVNATQTALVQGATLGTYASNPNTGATVGNIPATANQGYGVIDVINSNTTATSTAFRISANFSVGGIRFNTANANGQDWNVDGTGTVRNINIGNGSILVGPNVGARNVNFNGASQFRTGTNAEFYIHQFNTQGDLVLNNPMSQSAGTGTRFTKDGPGRLILAGSNTLGGQTTILEGTMQIGNGGATGTLNGGAVVNQSTLVFNRSNDYAVANVISGAGLLRKIGAGTLTLSGANTYTGTTEIAGGAINFSTLGSFGSGTQMLLAGGGLVWGTGNTGDISTGRTVTIGTGDTTLNTNGNNVTLANSIGNNGAGGVTKTGAGVLTLGGANLYSGNTAITTGGLTVTNTTGSATGSGNVSLANTTILSGSGTIAGATTIASGGKLTPGTGGVGTLTTGGLSLASGALLDLEFASTSSYDKVVVTNSGGLSIDGGNILLYAAGGTNPWATAGTYDLIQYSGTLGGAGASALNVLNTQPGYSYTFSSDGSLVKLQIALDSVLTQWNATAGGSWDSAGNWSNGVAAANYTAQFTTDLGAPATVTLDGNRFTNGLSFASSATYTIASGSGGSLTLERSTGNVGAIVAAGDHVISAPVVLNTTLAASLSSATSLTLSGVVSGVGGVVKSGTGTLDLTGSNTFSGSVNIVGGVLGFANGSSLGTGDITLNGGTLRYDTANTADISSKVINFGLNGATIDTNGNSVTLANPLGNSGVGSFTKAGLGTLTLSGANTYTGQTIVTGGTLAFSANANLGAASTGAGLTLNGAVLAPSATVSLDNAGANARPLTIGANGAEFSVANGLTLTVPGTASGSGAINKTGAGDLVLSGSNGGLSGPVTISAGNVRLGNNTANGQNGLGSGAITFGDGTHLYLNGYQTEDAGTSFGILANALTVPTGVTGNLHLPQRGGYSGVVTGAGTLNLSVDATRSDITGAWPAFTGQFNIVKTPTGAGTETDDYRMVGAHNLAAAKVNVGPGVRVLQAFNPPTGSGTSTVNSFGELNVDAGAILSGNPVGGRFNNYTVGALNTDFTISGQLRGNLDIFGYGYPMLTKVGTGTLTLNNSHLMTGAVNVNAGTLRLLGAIERHYTLAGVDLTFGRHPTSLVCDDVISLTEPTTGVLGTDYQNTEPGAVTVATGATLAGNGKLGGVTTINGSLRPDATGTLTGRLAFTKAATLTLSASATTQFDFAANKFTGVSVEAAGGLTYGGALKLNFLDTVYDGSYTLFQATGAAGAFTAVSAVASGTETPLAETASGSGVWTATVGAVSYTFTTATGVLEVSGGTAVVLPSVPGSVAASAGNAQVSLTWSASSNATGYLVKRSTTSGSGYATVASDVTATSYVDTGLTNGTTYYYLIEAANALGTSGNSAEVSATPTAVVYTALQNWRFEQFGVYDDDGTVLAGDTEDFDGDGLVNILEYALDTNAKVANASPVVVGRSGNFLTLTYPRKATADVALTYTVEGTSALGTTAFAAGTGATNTVGTTSTYTDDVNLTTNPRRFLRLSVGYTAPTP